MQSKDLSSLLDPQSVAIVGASAKENSWPVRIWTNLQRFGYPGKIYPVNPRHETLWGLKCYPSLEALPEIVDNALINVPAPIAVELLQQEKSTKFRAATILSGGFGEGNDPDGLKRKEFLEDFVRERGVRLCGPNCMGLVSTRSRAVLFPDLRLPTLPLGALAVVSQSGGLVGSLARVILGRGLGLSYFVSSGNEVDAELSDYLVHFLQDKDTRVIVAIIEGVRDAEKFIAAAERATAQAKPIIALKIGRSPKGCEAALAHTGALAGSDAVFDAVCREHGIIRVGDLDELANTVELFLRLNCLPAGQRAAFITFSGGLRGFIADLAHEDGLELPDLAVETEHVLKGLLGVGTSMGNPLDTGWSGLSSQETYLKCVNALIADPGVDMLALQEELPLSDVRPDKEQNLMAVADVARGCSKPIAIYSMASQGVNDYGRQFKERCSLPFVEGAHHAVRVLKHLGKFAAAVRMAKERQARASRAVLPLSSSEREVLATKNVLNEWDSYPLMERYGVPVARTTLVGTADEAVKAALAIGCPVALKICADGVVHKTELGGVRANLLTADEIGCACAEMAATFTKACPGASLRGFLVQESIRGGIETIIGVINDQQFGPAVMFGLGGIHVEVYRDVVFRVAPVTKEKALEMIRSIKGFALLAGFRGGAAVDCEVLSRAIVSVSELAFAGKELIESIDINPFICLQQGGRAVDAVIVSRKADG
jgi:acetyltransferase